MDDDRTHKALEALADLYLTGPPPSPPAEGARRAQLPSDEHSPSPQDGNREQTAVDLMEQLDGPAPYRLSPQGGAVRPRNVDATWRDADDDGGDPPLSSTDAQARIEAVFLGNLPGFGGPWLTQYAHHLAGKVGSPVVLMHVDDEQIDLELVSTMAQRHKLDALSRACNVPVSDGVLAAFSALTGPDAPRIGAWLVQLPMPLNDVSLDTAPDLARWTLICGADQAAVAGAHRWLKELGERSADVDRRRVGVTVMGSDAQQAAQIIEALGQTASSELAAPIELIACIKRMVPVQLKVLGSYAGGAAVWGRVARFLATLAGDEAEVEATEGARASARGYEAPAPRGESAALEDAAQPTVDVADAQPEPIEMTTLDHVVIDQFEPDRQPDISVLTQFESAALFEAPGVVIDDSAGSELPMITESDEPTVDMDVDSASDDEVDPADTGASVPATPEVSTPMTTGVRRFMERMAGRSAPPALAPSPVSSIEVEPPPQVASASHPLDDVDVQSATPVPDQPPVEEPSPPPPAQSVDPGPRYVQAPAVATVEPAPDAIDLTQFVDGVIALRAQCPAHKTVRLAVDSAGRLHLMLRADGSAEKFRLAMFDLAAARQWAIDHAQLLQMAHRQVRLDQSAPPMGHLFTSNAKAAVAVIPGVGHVEPAVRVHLLQQVAVAGSVAWACTELA